MTESTNPADMQFKLDSIQKPDFVDDDSSNICISHLDCGNIIVGHEKGCYSSSIEADSTCTELNQFRNKEVVSTCTKTDDRNQVFVACEKSVYFYDTRISLQQHQHCFSHNADEINDIKVNKFGQLAACDDAGEIQIFDLKTNSVFRNLRRKHTNICSCVSFLPDRADEILSGGLDSQIFAWDFKRVKIIQTVNTQALLSQVGDDSVYMFNPPLVYALNLAADGKVLASGLGNGTIQLFKVLKGKQVLVPFLLINRHSTIGVSALCFVDGANSSTLVSGGNDGIVNLWNIPDDSKVKGKKRTPITNNVCTDEEIQNLLTGSVDTHSKINFVANAAISNEQFVFVGDQTPCVKYFKICV